MVLFESTTHKCMESGLAKHSATLDRLKTAIDGSGIAATATVDFEANIYYQGDDLMIIEKLYRDSRWTQRNDYTFSAKPYSTLATVNYNSGDEVGVYCISNNGLLKEWRHSLNRKDWYSGALSERLFRPFGDTKLAVLRWDATNAMRVFAQDIDNGIQEYIGPDWKEGQKFQVSALLGTSLAVACYKVDNEDRVCVRLYYQAADMTLKEHCMDNFDGNWFEGKFETGKMMPHASIATLKLHVYCQNESQNIVGHKCEPGKSWTSDGQVLADAPGGGFSSVLQWKDAT